MFQLGRKIIRSLPSTALSIAMALCAFSTLIACEPKHESVDERQAAVEKANVSLSKIDSIRKELKTINLPLEASNKESESIVFFREPELILAQAKLEEFILTANYILEVAKRTDVMWDGQTQLELRLEVAKLILRQIKKRLENPTELFGARFWETRDACQISLSNGVEVGSVRWHSSHSFDERQIQKLSRDQRLELAKRIREQIACDMIVQRSYQVLLGSSRPVVEPTGLKFGPLVAKLEAVDTF